MSTFLQAIGRGAGARRRSSRILSPVSMASHGRASSDLRFTEWLFFGALSLAYLLSFAVPLFGFPLHQTALAHVPLMLLALVLVVHLAGVLFNRNPPAWGFVFAACWPLLLLAMYVLCGSAFAKWQLDINETYLAFGAYLLLLPVYMVLAGSGERDRAWARTLIAVWVMWSVIALLSEVAKPGNVAALHELEFLVATGFLAVVYATTSGMLQLLAIACLAAAMVLNHKLTGYLCGLLALLHIVASWGWNRMDRSWRGLYSVSIFALIAIAAVSLFVLYFAFREYLPSGNADVRLAQYEQAWRQFSQSPLWGNAYMAGSGEVFTEGARRLNIPTHSDVLDVLKHGGLIGFFLFSLGLGKLFVVIHRAIALTTGDRILNAYFIGARFLLVTALITFAVNPLLLKGPFLIVIWGNLGLAAGLGLSVSRRATVAHEQPTRAL